MSKSERDISIDIRLNKPKTNYDVKKSVKEQFTDDLIINPVSRKLRKNEKICKFPGCNAIFRAKNNKQKYCPEHSKQNLKKKDIPRRNRPLIQWTCGCTDSIILKQLYQQNDAKHRALFSVFRLKTKGSTHRYSVKCICCGNEAIIEDNFIRIQSPSGWNYEEKLIGRKLFEKTEKDVIYGGIHMKSLKEKQMHKSADNNYIEPLVIHLKEKAINGHFFSEISTDIAL